MKETILRTGGMFSKSLVFLAIGVLCLGVSVSQGAYLLDTFSDDTPGNLPNGPEVGSASYAGTAGKHVVISLAGGDLRLQSIDGLTTGSMVITYTPIAVSELARIDYLMRIESGSILVAQNAFSQELTFSPLGANIFLYWADDNKLYVRITRPGLPDTTIPTGYSWSFDTDYHITWIIDMGGDTFNLVVNFTTLLKEEAIGVDVTDLNWLYFVTNYDTTGSQLLDNVMIDRICDGPCMWYVDDSASGNGDGTSWENAFRYLQDALEAAASGDEIKVADGTYKPDEGGSQTPGDRTATFQLISGVAIKGGYGGFGEADPDIRDIESYETILSGDIGTPGNNSDNSLHVVASNFDDHTAILDGFTITGGNAEGAYPDYVGGGMYIDYSSPTVTNCLFINNSAGAGGGLAVWHECSPTIINCIFIANTSIGAGGALCFQHSSPTLISCMILGNTADSGGGMWTLNNYDTPKLTNCVFSGNATMSSGGGVSNAGVGGPNPNPPVLTNCTFNDNSAAVSGGGLYNAGGNDATVNSCIFWDNSDAGGTDESAQIHTSSITPAIDYTCVQGLTDALGGTGNIGDDPWFVDADGADDVVGTEDDDVHLLEDSPCIDAGHPAVEYQDVDGSRNDMGAYGGQFGEIYEPTYTGTGFIFNNIGELPTTEIGRDGNEPNVGLANVEHDIAVLFGVPEYKDSPFGSTLRVRGQFGPYDDVDFYQIMLAKWDDGNEPAQEDYTVLGEEEGGLSLGKVRWFVDANGIWRTEYVRMGPKTIDGREYLYQFNRPLDESIWSNPDLRIRWNTRVCENGLYTLTYKAYRWADPCETTLVEVSLPPTDGWDHLILHIDNNPVEAIIHDVRYDPNAGNPNYDPCTDGLIEECAIIGLTSPDENLRFTITASHPMGYLRHYVLDAISGKNNYRGVITSDSYTSTTPPYWDGVHHEEFQSSDGSQDPWDRCAYQFRLRCWARTTNGDYYIYYDIFSDHYYLDFGLTTCMRADIDSSGTVDFKDLAELANHWMETCEL